MAATSAIANQTRYSFGSITSGASSVTCLRVSGLVQHTLQIVASGNPSSAVINLQGSIDQNTQGIPNFVPTNWFNLGSTVTTSSNGTTSIITTAIVDYVQVNYVSGSGTIVASYAGGNYQ